MRITRDTLHRTIRTLAQGQLVVITIALLRSFGVPITDEQLGAIQAFVGALGAAVLVWNGIEDTTGRTLLK